MKKYIFILDALELMTKLMVGKRVEGVLYMDENTGHLTFKAYNRQPRVREKDRMVKKGPHGEETAVGLGEGVDGAHQGVWQFSEGLLYGTGHRVAQRAQPGCQECTHREGTGPYRILLNLKSLQHGSISDYYCGGRIR